VNLLGVDFGTSHTVAVLGRSAVETLLFDSTPLLPSGVYAEAGARLLVGRDAQRGARLQPSAYEPNPKRRIDDAVLLLGDAEIPVSGAVGAVLRRVLAEAERTLGAPPGRVTLTHPAGWGASRRGVLLEAAALAGLPSPGLVAEPVAAALYFTRVLGNQVPAGHSVIVYDLGGGTFDISVVRRAGDDTWDLVADAGLDDVGGVDLDAAVVDWVARTIGARDPALWQRLDRPATTADQRHRRLLWDEAQAAKEQLSRSSSAGLAIPLFDVEAHLTRDELERLARPWLDRTVVLTTKTLITSGVTADRIAGLFLVGGSSRIPLIATLLHQSLGLPPVVIEQPELVVAQGSIYAVPKTVPAPSAVGPPPRAAEASQLLTGEALLVAGGRARVAEAPVGDEIAMPSPLHTVRLLPDELETLVPAYSEPEPDTKDAPEPGQKKDEPGQKEERRRHPVLLAVTVAATLATLVQIIQYWALQAPGSNAEYEVVQASGPAYTFVLPVVALVAAVMAYRSREKRWSVALASLVPVAAGAGVWARVAGLRALWPLGWTVFYADFDTPGHPDVVAPVALALLLVLAVPVIVYAARGSSARPVTAWTLGWLVGPAVLACAAGAALGPITSGGNATFGFVSMAQWEDLVRPTPGRSVVLGIGNVMRLGYYVWNQYLGPGDQLWALGLGLLIAAAVLAVTMAVRRHHRLWAVLLAAALVAMSVIAALIPDDQTLGPDSTAYLLAAVALPPATLTIAYVVRTARHGT
jgi:Ethanolamine utilization protein EutJ (predicted chaperonin)